MATRYERAFGRRVRWPLTLVLILTGGALGGACGPDADLPSSTPGQAADGGSPDAGGTARGAAAQVFQPGFHQALRLNVQTGALATFRMLIPVGRTGGRLRVVFLAGDGPLRLARANVARADRNGELAGAAKWLTFDSAPSTAATARQRVKSDPLAFPVRAGDELLITFEAEGALGASKILNFSKSSARLGAYAATQGSLGGVEHPRAVGVATVEVEGPRTRAVVAIGNSITEGYVEGRIATGEQFTDGAHPSPDDYRNAWTRVAEMELGIPVVNAGVSGQGFDEALANINHEVLALEGITDCVVLLGINDLGRLDATMLIERYSRMIDRLRGFCRVWAGTLTPNARVNNSNYAMVRERRARVNAWIRQSAPVEGVIDFEAVVRSPSDPDRFAPGMGMDGLHPTVEGLRRMGLEAARVLRETPAP